MRAMRKRDERNNHTGRRDEQAQSDEKHAISIGPFFGNHCDGTEPFAHGWYRAHGFASWHTFEEGIAVDRVAVLFSKLAGVRTEHHESELFA